MLQIIQEINTVVNQLVWGVPAMICIMGIGLYISISTGFVQLRKFGYAMQSVIGRIFDTGEAQEGTMTSYQAVCTALAATIGTGNIAGVAGAITIGGPGAVFWMWISALFGMCTKFAEVTLAVRFREKNGQGEYVGGPMYYIKNGLGRKWMWLAYLFAGFGIFTVFGTGNAVQVNTIVTSIDAALLSYGLVSKGNLGTLNLLLGIGIAILVAMILLGGIQSVGRVSEKLVPFMAIFYTLLSLGVIIINRNKLPGVVVMIVQGAFQPSAFTGGVVGSFLLSMKKGISRGVFSNEAGLGTGSIAHACADTDAPVKQGLFGIFEVFVDTIVICTLTALVILCSDIRVPYGIEAGAELTIAGFVATYGNWVTIFTAVAMCCFAFATVIGWGLYGVRFVEFIASEKLGKAFLLVYAFVAVIGATLDFGLLWSLTETFNGLMAIPNLIALLLLNPTIVNLTKEYFANVRSE